MRGALPISAERDAHRHPSPAQLGTPPWLEPTRLPRLRGDTGDANSIDAHETPPTGTRANSGAAPDVSTTRNRAPGTHTTHRTPVPRGTHTRGRRTRRGLHAPKIRPQPQPRSPSQQTAGWRVLLCQDHQRRGPQCSEPSTNYG